MTTVKTSLTPIKMTFAEIESFSEKIAREHSFVPQKKSVRDFVKELGGRIEILELPNVRQLQSGSLRVIKKNEFTIFLSPITSPLRDNFTIAHEIGHYFLHILPSEQLGKVPFIEIGRHGDDKLEQQANRFAAALLMPRSEFIAIAQREPNLNVLAGRFRVSLQAAEVRFNSLKKAGIL